MPCGWPKHWSTTHPNWGKLIATLADDPDIRVRYQLAFTLGAVQDPTRYPALAKIIRRDPADSWLRLAVFSSLAEGSGEVFSILAADPTWRKTDAGRGLLQELARSDRPPKSPRRTGQSRHHARIAAP